MTLLIVDDEADLRDVLTLSFQRKGFKVLEASNGREAIEIVRTQPIDLVVSDINMPGGNGVELLEAVRAYHHEVPVLLFITGFADITVEDAYNKGAEAVFAKPFDFKNLLKAVQNALEPKDTKWSRKEWRGETALPIEIKGESFNIAKDSKVVNMGRGGLFVACEKNLPRIGHFIDFKIYFTSGAPISIEGRGIVRWVRPAKENNLPLGYGVEFIELSDETRSKVTEFVNFLKTKQYIPKV